MWYVYIHFKPNGRPFYVGKGRKSRAYTIRRQHNTAHVRTLEKYGEDSILVWRTVFPSHDEAVAEEIRIIHELRSMGVPIVNMTNGGDGTVGLKRTAEQCAANGVLKIGNKNMKGKSHSQESKGKIRDALKRHFSNPLNRSKHSLASRGKFMGDGFSQKMSDVRRKIKWVTNGFENRQIPKDQEIKDGWRPGRTWPPPNKGRAS